MDTFNKDTKKNNRCIFSGAKPGLSDFVTALLRKYIYPYKNLI